jgi:hypothetical protein
MSAVFQRADSIVWESLSALDNTCSLVRTAHYSQISSVW